MIGNGRTPPLMMLDMPVNSDATLLLKIPQVDDSMLYTIGI
jgi:hypothetical protein